jgi:hypothetical protein
VPSYLFNNGEPLTINGLPYAPGGGAPGKIDDVQVYSRALTAAEIASIAIGSDEITLSWMDLNNRWDLNKIVIDMK